MRVKDPLLLAPYIHTPHRHILFSFPNDGVPTDAGDVFHRTKNTEGKGIREMDGKTLKLLRSYHNMKQNELANRLGISKSYLSEIETSKKIVTLELLHKYSETFNMPPSALLLLWEKLKSCESAESVEYCNTSRIITIMQWILDKQKNAM